MYVFRMFNTMKNTLEDIRAKAADGKFTTRERLRLSLVARVLIDLGWDVWDPEEVIPDFEFGPEGDRTTVDIALSAGASIHPVFIVTAEPGTLESDSTDAQPCVSAGPEALLIPRLTAAGSASTVAVITDGKLWKFYYIHGDDPAANKCFKTIDMLDDPVDTVESTLSAYLAKERIADGSALRDAHDYLWLSAAVQAVTDALPQARQIVNEPPYPRLPQAIAQVVSEKGIDISEKEVLKILSGIDKQKTPPSMKAVSPISLSGTAPAPEEQTAPVKQSEPELTKNKKATEKAVQDSTLDFEPISAQETPSAGEQIPDRNPRLHIRGPDNHEVPSDVETHGRVSLLHGSDVQPAAQVSRKPQASKPVRLNLLNRKILSFGFLGDIYHPKSWKEMLMTFCEIIYAKHTGEFYKCLKLRINNRLCFSKNIKDFFGHSPVQIGESDFFLMTDLNSNEIVELVYNILELFHYDKNDIDIAVN